MTATGNLLFATLAQAGPPAAPPPPGWDGRLIQPGLYLVGALLVGAMVIAVVGRWRKTNRAVSVTPSEQLAAFRTLYDRGEMSQAEFDRVKALLGNQLRPAAAPAPPPAPAPPAPANGQIEAPAPPVPPPQAEGPPSDGVKPA